VGQKLPVQVQNAHETAELTGGLGSLAVLKMGFSLSQRLGTLGGHLVTEEGDFGCSENAFRRVVGGPVPLKSVEECPWMLHVPLERPGKMSISTK
jgi:hypothetical protein